MVNLRTLFLICGIRNLLGVARGGWSRTLCYLSYITAFSRVLTASVCPHHNLYLITRVRPERP